jgi:electron transfer flavoprotein-quinone oxidoreductase
MGADNKVDVIVVGAGPAGLACAYTLAKKGVEVLVIERGSFPGSKNMFGGIFFSSMIEKLFPEFIAEAPWERFVSRRRFFLLAGENEIAFEMKPKDFNTLPYNHSFIVKRSQVDNWFAKKAESAGANIICEYCVKDFLYEGNKVVGITSGGDDDSLFANVVVCAEGVNSLLSEKSGLRKRISPELRSMAVKENIRLPRETIEERFGLSEKQGAAYEFFGSSVEGLLGNGFIYTNVDSLSVGVGFSVKDFMQKGKSESPNDILEKFKNHPSVAPLLKGGETVEYMAHMIPCDNFNRLPKLYRDGLLLVGDAAGLVNTSFFHEGVNLAMASGVFAAETILEALAKKDFSSATLSEYKNKLDKSFVMQDLRQYRGFISFLDSHRGILNEYPGLLAEVLTDYFTVSEKPKNQLKKEIFRKVLKKIGVRRLLGDLLGIWRNLI